jgi:hypothetical protein
MGYPTKASKPQSKQDRSIDRKLTNTPSVISSVKDGVMEGVDSNGVAYTKDVCEFKFTFPQLEDINFTYFVKLEVRASAKRIVDEFTLVDIHGEPKVRKDSFLAKNVILAITDYDVTTKTQVKRYETLDAFYSTEKPVLKGSLQKLYTIFSQQETGFEYILNPDEFAEDLTGKSVNVSTYISKGKAFVTSPAYNKTQPSNRQEETTNRKVARGLWS